MHHILRIDLALVILLDYYGSICYIYSSEKEKLMMSLKMVHLEKYFCSRICFAKNCLWT